MFCEGTGKKFTYFHPLPLHHYYHYYSLSLSFEVGDLGSKSTARILNLMARLGETGPIMCYGQPN